MITNYDNMLSLFWKNHDTTSKCTRQYMSAIFYNSPEQKKAAEESFQKMEAEMKGRSCKIQTKILPATKFYIAEDYHQKYLLQQYPEILGELDIDPGEELQMSHVACRLNGYVGGYGNISQFELEYKKLGLPKRVENKVRTIILTQKQKVCC